MIKFKREKPKDKEAGIETILKLGLVWQSETKYRMEFAFLNGF